MSSHQEYVIGVDVGTGSARRAIGAAMLAAVAAGRYSSIVEAMAAMSPRAEVIEPNPADAEFHARKYQVFKLMYEHQLEYRRLMTAC